MTPALQKMVEAMAAELSRQADADDGYLSFPTAGDLSGGLIGYDGTIDLEKVARAGLEAIDDPSPDNPIFDGHDPAAPQAVHDYIRWITGEKPRLELLSDNTWHPWPRS